MSLNQIQSSKYKNPKRKSRNKKWKNPRAPFSHGYNLNYWLFQSAVWVTLQPACQVNAFDVLLDLDLWWKRFSVSRMWFFLFVLSVAINCSLTLYFACYCIAIEGFQFLYVLGLLESFLFCALGWILTCTSVSFQKKKKPIWVAVISAKNHKRQSVTAKREKSQTPKVLTAILTLPHLT